MQGNYRLTIIPNEKNKKFTVGELNPGDVVKYNNRFYMRTNLPGNAVGEVIDLQTGDATWFGESSTSPVPVKCSLREE